MGSRELKVYGGMAFRRGSQERAVVAVHNKKELATILGESLYHANVWWGRTGNIGEIKRALAKPFKIIYVG